MKKKENKKKETKKIILLLIAILIVLAIIANICIGYYRKLTYSCKNPIATIEIKDYGTIQIELYPEYAENTVKNFIALANNGFYDGLTFHRIIKDFMVQGGDAEGDGSGSPSLSAIDKSVAEGSTKDTTYNIDGEFAINGYKNNTLKLEKGVIAMARTDYTDYVYYYGLNSSIIKEGYNSAGSQFFIMTTDDNISLTGYYAGFGKIINSEGYDVLEKLANTKVEAKSESDTEKSTPVEAPVITSIRVETFDGEYDMPKTHEQFDLNSYLTSLYQ